jgi:hypothetical protein
MAALITVEELRANFAFVIHEDVPDARLAFPIISASARLKAWVGQTTYAAALDDNETAERKMILQHAEGYLALHYALIGLNTHLRNFGLVKAEQVEGNAVNTYFTPADAANFTTQYLEMAREIAEPYLLQSGTPTVGFEVVQSD